MAKFIIRNDDVAFDTDLNEFKWFCNLCDEYNYPIMQCVTPLGRCISPPGGLNVQSDRQILLYGGPVTIFHNEPLMEYLLSRKDLIAVHGLWHTHKPDLVAINVSKRMLESVGLNPTYYVPPFNEGDYPEEIAGLKVSQLTDRLEDYHIMGSPTKPIAYLHSWRYGTHYPKQALEDTLKRLGSYQE
jgi:hypothetical protein